MFRKLHLGLSIASLAVAAVLGIATPVHAQNTEAGIKCQRRSKISPKGGVKLVHLM